MASGLWPVRGAPPPERALLPINASALVSITVGGIAGFAGNRTPPRPGPRHPWHALEPEESLDLVESSRGGLGTRERRRRDATSTARVIAAPVGLLQAAVDELANPLTPVLALGAALSAAVGSTTDAVLVGGVVA